MKKTNFHVNPAVNKWEEEQRRARMEKMIQRAKSTLPPEARGGVKPSGPKKPSPYTAENNASKLVRKRSTTGGQGTPSGAAAMDAQELDSLIYNRVQEILGMPLMRRAAAARTAFKGGAQTKPPASGRGGRRPAWNDEWSAQAASTPSNHDERHVAGVGSRGGTSNAQYERSPSKSSPAAKPRPSPTHGTSGTPTKGSRIPVPARLEVVALGNNSNNLGGMQRRPSGRAPGAVERVILLPSPSAAAAASRGSAGRPPSSRYGSGAGAGAAAVGDPAAASVTSGHLLGESVVAAIEALNPQAPAAREAASRIAEHRQQQQQADQQQGQFCGLSGRGASVAGLGVSGAASGVSGSFRGSSGEVGRVARHLSGSASALGAAGRDASLMQSVTAAAGGSEGGSPGTGASITASSLRRPPLAPAPRASGRGVPQGAHQASPGPKGGEGEEEEDAYADDDFEEYEGTDDEGGGRKAEAGQADDNDEDGGSGDAGGVEPEVALLRDSVNALNGLVQLKIQQEVARSQQQPLETQQDPPAHRRSSQTGAGPGGRGGLGAQRPSAAAAAPDVLASLALVGTDDLDGRGHGPGRGDPANSSLGDGLRQSDLDYLARLGGGEPNDGAEVATSTDERPFAIEPGAPAGTVKAWGDRQPWATVQDADAGATGLLKLRERQERERQQQQAAVAHAGGVQQQQQQRLSQHREEEDSVLLGETLSPRNRSGAAAQMQAVSSALAALASSGQLTAEDAQDLRTQTDALYGSLVQLHNLMNGPRGAELCSGSPSSSNGGGGGGGAKGFTPAGLSPAHSPSHTARRPPQAAGMAAAGAELSPGKPSAQMRLETVDALHVGKGEEAGLPRDTGGGDGSQLQQPGRGAGGSHLQLTPKHQLVAEDVAWMAGLVHSLSRSLQVENGEVDLPGV